MVPLLRRTAKTEDGRWIQALEQEWRLGQDVSPEDIEELKRLQPNHPMISEWNATEEDSSSKPVLPKSESGSGEKAADNASSDSKSSKTGAALEAGGKVVGGGAGDVMSGAGAGFSIGGPVGGAIGAGVGLLSAIAKREQKKRDLTAQGILGSGQAFQRQADQEQQILGNLMAGFRAAMIR